MEKLKKITQIVLKILSEDEEARKNDMHLSLKVHEFIYPGIKDMPLHEVLDLINLGALPNWECIGRARRKMQERHPELRDEFVSDLRYAEEEKYRQFFARS